MKRLLQASLLVCLAVVHSHANSANDVVTQENGANDISLSTKPSVRVLLVPQDETTISSTLSARIVKLDASLGSNFKAKQVLVAFECDEAFARIAMSQAELASTIDQHEAKVKMQGLEQASEIEVSMAASAANKAKAQLSLHRAQASKCKVRAPWSGRVAKVFIKNHTTPSAGQPLIDLVKNGPVKLKLNLPSTYLQNIHKGKNFVVSIDETKSEYQASISAINSRVDPVSQTIEVEATLTEEHKELLPGMSGISYLRSFH